MLSIDHSRKLSVLEFCLIILGSIYDRQFFSESPSHWELLHNASMFDNVTLNVLSFH